MSEKRKKYSEMNREEINQEYLRCLLSRLSKEELRMFLEVAIAISEDNYDKMPEPALEFFALRENASEEEKTRARIALAKKRGELIEQSC